MVKLKYCLGPRFFFQQNGKKINKKNYGAEMAKVHALEVLFKANVCFIKPKNRNSTNFKSLKL